MTDESDPVHQIDDPDDYNQKQRIRELNDARKDVKRARNELNARILERPQDHQKAAVAYIEHVKTYAMELQGLIKEEDSKLWDEKELLHSTVSHPNPSDAPTGATIEHEISIEGIRGLLQTEFPLSVEFDVVRDPAHELPRTESVEVAATPTFADGDQIVMELDQFRRSDAIGLGLSAEPETGVDDDPF